MHPAEFAAKWRDLAPRMRERAAYQEHWRDLCLLLGEPTPTASGLGDAYAFERHVKKVGTGETGYADVYREGHFIVEYKAQGKSLGKAWQQAVLYAAELGNPPLIVVSDLERIEIHTNFTGSAPRTIRIALDDIARDAPVGGDLTALGALRALFRDPGRLDPRALRERVTADATARIGEVGRALGARGVPPQRAAHFLMRLVFAMFAEDVGLLPRGLLTRVLERAKAYPERSEGYFAELFSAMQSGGEFWDTDIRHFNGGLFDDGTALPITTQDAAALLGAATLDWAQVEPAIFGTLFENSLDTETRSRRGAHYTSVRDILRIVTPVVLGEVRREWAEVRTQAEMLLGKRNGKVRAFEAVRAFHARLGEVRVLDPACGSGNFLVVTLLGLLDLEQEVRVLGDELGAGLLALVPHVHPRQLLGLEVEAFAHELASVSVWIAYFQWKAAHGGDWDTPVLQRLNTIERADALLTPEGAQQPWPRAEFIVGNPPFLGGKMLRRRLTSPYVDRLFAAYAGHVPREADLVVYWVERARAQVETGATRRVGLVTTNSIRGGANRRVLDRVKTSGDLFLAWPDEPWLQDGAAVRVSLLGFDDGQDTRRTFNGHEVSAINADLSSRPDVTAARPLPDNLGLSFMGTTKGGPFDVPGEVARAWLSAPPNPNGRTNADVVRPWVNGLDLVRRPRGMWIVDFGGLGLDQASDYLLPYAFVEQRVKPERETNARDAYRTRWWQHMEPRPAMRAALEGLSRYIGTARVAKHRLFVWLTPQTVPDSQVIVIAREDDFGFGVLQSRVHEVWARTLGSSMGVGNDLRYTPSTTFETFPFPQPSLAQQADVETWARYLVQVRDHLLAQDARATLTGLYNAVQDLQEHPDPAHPVSALVAAHARLDAAVAASYGWSWPLAEDEVLARLLALNLERSSATPAPV